MKLKFDVFLRIIADILLVNLSLIVAFVLRFLWFLFSNNNSSQTHQILMQNGNEYLHAFWLLTIISIIVFTLSGFYTRGRAYKSRFKALVIFQAVSVSYLILTLIAFLCPHCFTISRAIIVTAWLVTLFVILFSRLWSVLWRNIVLASSSVDGYTRDEKQVLVIGGAGYIGSALLPKLLDAGCHVRILDLFLYGEKPIEKYLDHPQVEIIRADFRQVDKVVEAVKGIGAVIHLGAIVGDPACALNEELTVEVNLMATKMIAEVCKGHGIKRFIFASTCSVYGASDEILDEKSRLNPVSLYARSKIASEKVLQAMADDKFSPVILRFGTLFGMSGRMRFDLVVNILTAKACFDKKITVFGGDQWRPFMHVDDAAKSVFMALKAPIKNVDNEVFNVGANENNYTLGEVGELVKHQVPDAELLDMGMDGDRRNYRVDFTKLRKKVGFGASWTLEAGISQIINVINKGAVPHYTDTSFSNVKILEDTLDIHIVSRHLGRVKDLIIEIQK